MKLMVDTSVVRFTGSPLSRTDSATSLIVQGFQSRDGESPGGRCLGWFLTSSEGERRPDTALIP